MIQVTPLPRDIVLYEGVRSEQGNGATLIWLGINASQFIVTHSYGRLENIVGGGTLSGYWIGYAPDGLQRDFYPGDYPTYFAVVLQPGERATWWVTFFDDAGILQTRTLTVEG